MLLNGLFRRSSLQFNQLVVLIVVDIHLLFTQFKRQVSHRFKVKRQQGFPLSAFHPAAIEGYDAAVIVPITKLLRRKVSTAQLAFTVMRVMSAVSPVYGLIISLN